MSASWPCCAGSRIPPWLPRTSSMPISGPTDYTPISRRRPVPTSIGRRSRSDAPPRRSEAPQDAAIFFPMRLFAVLAIVTRLAASPPGGPVVLGEIPVSPGAPPPTTLVWLVQPGTMPPLKIPPACDMPHGVKVNHAGSFVYVSCMNSDEILEIDRQTLHIRRRHKTGEGMPGGHAAMNAAGPPPRGTAPAPAPPRRL